MGHQVGKLPPRVCNSFGEGLAPLQGVGEWLEHCQRSPGCAEGIGQTLSWATEALALLVPQGCCLHRAGCIQS